LCVEFDAGNSMHLLFIKSCSILYAQIFGVSADIDDSTIIEYFNKHKDALKEKAMMKLEKSEEGEKESVLNINKIIQEHEKYSFIVPIEFEKDDDTNYHVDFIYACANIRAQNYKIKEATKLQVKGIAGRIIPAIATTTAMVSGLSVLEMFKYILKCKVESFRNSYLTLALPLVACSEPLEPFKAKVSNAKLGVDEYTLWTKLEFDDMKLRDFLEMFNSEYEMTITMLSCNGVLVFCSFYQQSRYECNMDKSFRELSKAGEGVKYVVLDCLFTDEEAEIPCIVIKLQ